MSKSQYLLSAIATGVAFSVFAESYVSIAMASDKVGFEPNTEQKVTTRQVALLLDRMHYLKQPLDREMGAKFWRCILTSLTHLARCFCSRTWTSLPKNMPTRSLTA